jgi:hypothetical protein
MDGVARGHRDAIEAEGARLLEFLDPEAASREIEFTPPA